MKNFNILYLDLPLLFDVETCIYTIALRNILHNKLIVNCFEYKDLLEKRISKEDIHLLFYSDFGYINYSDEFDDILKIYITIEDCMPNLNVGDYFISTCPDNLMGRNLTCPTFMYYCCLYRNLDNDVNKLYKEYDEKYLFNRKFASYIVSNNIFCDARRLELFDVLNSYEKVYAPAKAKHNCEFSDFLDNQYFDQLTEKRNFVKHFKFNLSLENTISPNYITEKIFDAFYNLTIPIYYGDPELSHKVFNEKSFIDATLLTNDELLDYVKEINEDKNKYLDMLFQPKINLEHTDYLLNIYNFLIHILNNPQKRMIKNGTHKRFMKEIYKLWINHKDEVIDVNNLI